MNVTCSVHFNRLVYILADSDLDSDLTMVDSDSDLDLAAIRLDTILAFGTWNSIHGRQKQVAVVQW